MNTYEFDYKEDRDKYCRRVTVKANTYDEAEASLNCKHVTTLILRLVTTPDGEKHGDFPFGPRYDIKL